MKNRSNIQHAFRGVRDPLVINASIGNNPSMISLTTDGSGNGQQFVSLAPFGFAGVSTGNAVAGQPITFVSTSFQSPTLPWLYNQARNFERYRVTRAVLIAVGNLGSTATGRILLDSSTDASDNISAITTATSTGGKVFDVGSLANKEARLQLDVDTAWKKCSSRTFGVDTNSTTLVPLNSVNDLIFSNIYIGCTGVSATSAAPVTGTIVAQFYVEYDVEFRDPISYGVNI